jgi:large subunit ribosomal protein L19
MAEETQKQENIEETAEVAETPVAEAEVAAETPVAEAIEPTESVEEVVVEEPDEPGIIEASLKDNLPEIRQGDMVKVYQKIKEKNKDRVQIFDGQVLAIKHGRGISATITVRKVISGIGVEKIFPIHSPSIDKIEVTKQTKTRRAKLYYLRTAKGRKAKLKTAHHKVAEAEVEEVEVAE